MKLRTLLLVLGVGPALVATACSSSSSSADPTTTTAEAGTAETEAATSRSAAATSAPVSFTAEVWADNWFSLTVNGEAVGEDSVPINTERSFNSETIDFEATYPLTVAVVTKDFKEDDSGLEYNGTPSSSGPPT